MQRGMLAEGDNIDGDIRATCPVPSSAQRGTLLGHRRRQNHLTKLYGAFAGGSVIAKAIAQRLQCRDLASRWRQTYWPSMADSGNDAICFWPSRRDLARRVEASPHFVPGSGDIGGCFSLDESTGTTRPAPTLTAVLRRGTSPGATPLADDSNHLPGAFVSRSNAVLDVAGCAVVAGLN